jgi:hypothetical protein
VTAPVWNHWLYETEPKGEAGPFGHGESTMSETSFANFRYTNPWNLQKAPLKNSLLYGKQSGMETKKQ